MASLIWSWQQSHTWRPPEVLPASTCRTVQNPASELQSLSLQQRATKKQKKLKEEACEEVTTKCKYYDGSNRPLTLINNFLAYSVITSCNSAVTMTHTGTCKWFNTCLGLGFLTMTTMGGVTLDSPIKVFVHQSKIYTKGFHSWKDDEAVQFAFTESPKGLECIWVTGLGDAHCIDKKKPQRKDECYN
ncbi:hypothetical protein Q9966_015895 [Columba livia]|nr:hypothetical protein Q9966_015895 [Columba livia]